MSRMIGTSAVMRGSCKALCCTSFGKPCKRNVQPVKRTLKRRERQAWKKEQS